jgi:hypothetical protein
LYTHRPLVDEREEEAIADRQSSGLLGIAIILVLLIVGLFLVHRLHRNATIEDCLLAGHRNCDAVAVVEP